MNRKLILGGHSFIAQLGSDPAPDEKTQDAIVAACLDSGITTFDTTYLPERIALGKALQRLGRRSEAQLIAWNFFTDFGPEGSAGGLLARAGACRASGHLDAASGLRTGALCLRGRALQCHLCR